MEKTWREILDDRDSFKDDAQVPMGEGLSLSLGELRALDRARREELDGQAKVLDQAANAIAQLYEKAESAAARATQSPAQETARPATQTTTDLENDPLFAPVFQQVKSLSSDLSGVREELSKRDKMLEGIVKLYENDRMQNTFESLSDRPQDLSLESLAKYAMDNGIKDKLNRLDLKRAYQEYRRPDLERQRADQEYRRGIEEGKKAALIESAPKPRFSKPTGDSEAKRPGNVREAFDNMRGDNKLMADLNEALAGLSTTVQ